VSLFFCLRRLGNLFRVFPAITAVVSIYGLTADPANIEWHFSLLSTVLPAEAYDLVVEQVKSIASTSDRSLSWGLLVSVALALWSVSAGTQALFAALNIAYEEWRSLFQFYLSAFIFALIGLLGGVVVLLAIVYVPILFASVGLSSTLETVIGIGRRPFLALLSLLLLALALQIRSVPPLGEIALGQRGVSVCDDSLVGGVSPLLALCCAFWQLRPDLWSVWGAHHTPVLAVYFVLHCAAWG
jgi:uncharacterized BrkB/YihY/UPF0761 family membrane protein